MSVNEMDVLRVLIVEDSPIVADRLRESLLTVRGLKIIDTIDRENKAIEALERGGVDVVVLDLRLNRGTGFGVLRALSARDASGREDRPVVIIFTNYDLPEYRRQALALGADYFLDKARDFERLPSLIETLRGKPPQDHPPVLVPA